MLEINIILEDFYNLILAHNFNNEILSIIDNHRKNEDFIILASATNSLIVGYVAKQLLINEFVSSEVVFKDNLCTGIVKKPYALGSGKLELVTCVMKKYNFDFENAFFYSDSMNDYPLLSRVGNPIAVNPDKILEKKCLTMNWKVIRT